MTRLSSVLSLGSLVICHLFLSLRLTAILSRISGGYELPLTFVGQNVNNSYFYACGADCDLVLLAATNRVAGPCRPKVI